MATENVTGQKRSIEELEVSSDTDHADELPATKRRKIYIENNIILGIDTNDEMDKIANDVNRLTKTLSSDSVVKSNFVVIYNIDPVIEHCDIIDLCKEIAFPIALNYFRGTFGKAWLKFENHRIALNIVNKLNDSELEDKKLIVGLIENTPKYVDIKGSYVIYKRSKQNAYPQRTTNRRKHKTRKRKKVKNRFKDSANRKSNRKSKKKKNKKNTYTA
eukprot:21506_1